MLRALDTASLLYHEGIAGKSDLDGGLLIKGRVDETRFAEVGQRVIDTFPTELPARGIADIPSGFWTTLAAGHRGLVDLVRAGAPTPVAAYLANMVRNRLAYGLMHSVENLEAVEQRRAGLTFKRILYDRLLSACEFYGAAALANPESNDQQPYPPVAELMAALDAAAGYPVRAPNCITGYFGLARPGGLCDERTLHAVCNSRRIGMLLAELGLDFSEGHVLEIGGGIASLALHCIWRGIAAYTIVDLPTVRAIQTYVTAMEAPEFRGLQLRLPADLQALPDRSVPIVVNEDSFPEMDAAAALHYLREIARIGSGYFLSINHESRVVRAGHEHVPVLDLIAQVPGFRLVGRTRHWVRRGYVEEIYRIGR